MCTASLTSTPVSQSGEQQQLQHGSSDDLIDSSESFRAVALVVYIYILVTAFFPLSLVIVFSSSFFLSLSFTVYLIFLTIYSHHLSSSI